MMENKIINTVQISLVSLLFGISFTLLILQNLEAKKTISFASLAPKSSSWGKLIRNTARGVYKKSKKQVRIKVFYGGVQGDEKEMEEKIRFEQLDGGFFTGNGLGQAVRESRILEIPGLIKNYKELDYVYPRVLKTLDGYFNKKGYKLIGLVDVGYAYFFSKENISSLKDIRNTKMWTWKGDELSSKMMRRFDIPAVPVSLTEVIPSLQTGLINGVYATTTSLLSLQWHREVNYMMDLPITLVSGGVVLSKKTWDELSKSDQKIIQEVVTAELKKYQPVIRKSDKDSREILQKQGLKINSPKDTATQIEKTSAPLINDFPADIRDLVTRLLKEVRK